jgi:phage terminase small subunit
METTAPVEQDTPEKVAVEKDFGTYKVQVNYSKEAIENKTLKFITPSGDEFEVKGDELASIMLGTVNSQIIEAMFVESDRVNVVEVTRQIRVRLDKDFKKGDEIRLDYVHPYPIEFALIEEAAKIAKINMDVPALTLTAEYIKSVKEKITPKQRKFVDLIYKFFRDLHPNRKSRRATASP